MSLSLLDRVSVWQVTIHVLKILQLSSWRNGFCQAIPITLLLRTYSMGFREGNYAGVSDGIVESLHPLQIGLVFHDQCKTPPLI